MSAIAGIVRFDTQQVDQGLIDSMSRILSPYGRDAQHAWHGQAAALLRTLMRTTPEDSFDHQPLAHSPSDTILVFDGRLDNRDELISTLNLSKGDTETMPDSALALSACLAWECDTPKHLLGDWAIACWQPKRKRLWLARDPYGARPLFWHRQSTFIAFATLPKALFAIPGVPRAICEERLFDRIMLLPGWGPESLFKDIYRVEPGHVVVLEDGHIATHRYHQFDPERKIELPRDDDYLDAFSEQLERAVARQLRSCGPIGSHLSSGWDSSTVTALAARQLAARPQRLTTYTAAPRPGFNGPIPQGRHADEVPAARALTSRFDNIDHVIIRPEGISPIDTLQEDTELQDRFLNNPCNNVWLRAIEDDAEKRGLKVLLTGQMGNMSISYDGEMGLSDLWQQGEWRKWWREVSALKRRHPQQSWRGYILQTLGPSIPQPLWQVLNTLRKRKHSPGRFAEVHPDYLKRMQHRTQQSNWRPVQTARLSSREARSLMYNRADYSESNVAANARGLDLRDPTRDLRLVEFCLSLPESQYLRNGQRRWILQRMMENVLPPEILYAKTKGLQSADWYETTTQALPRIRGALAQMMMGGEIGKYLNLPILEASLNEWPDSGWENGATIHRYRLMLLRSLAIATFVHYVVDGNRWRQ